jgi:hypothetical protein
MLAEQDGKCAVCEKPSPEHVDHDHQTGVVRGMLCFNCNQALGNVRDSLEVLSRLSMYLTVRQPWIFRQQPVRYHPLDDLIVELDYHPHAAA